MKISYNWLKRYIKELPSKDELANIITFKICELEGIEDLPNGDTVFDIKILPDRAHDLLSHRGVAREIAGLLGCDFLDSPHNSLESVPTSLQIELNSPLCRRYIGRIVRNVKVGPSPKWLVEHLESIGQRSINNIVDITNFILFDTGQPIHAFDLDKLESKKIIVRNAREGERVELLGERIGNFIKERSFELKENNLVIADEKDILALAGVKGGKKAEVGINTKNILLEVANFDSISIRKTARSFGIQTDAVKRYENEIIPDWCDFVMAEVSFLIAEICKDSSFEDVVDIYNQKIEERKVSFSREYISKILGVKIEDKEIEKILKNYNYNFSHQSDSWEIIVPDKRLDITGAHDMVEEIGRVYGYDKIIPALPAKIENQKDNIVWSNICLAKQKLINDGYKEVYTYAFTDKGEVEVMASASDKNFLRTNLLDGLSKAYELNRLNSPLLGLSEVKIFEVGAVFGDKGEEIHVAYMDKKNKVEMILNDFIVSNDLSQKYPFDFFKLSLSNKEFKIWSLYPFIYRDIAVWVPEDTNPETLVNIYKEFGGDLLVKEPMLVDKFTKEGRTSYAYRLIFQSYDRTLQDEEVNNIVNLVTDKIKSLGFEPR
jgi:phenylalanyl-tRNA synthetase beta chain